MAEQKKNFEVVKKYYFRKNGEVEQQGYDWIGKACGKLYPVQLDGKLGFADSNGEIVVPIIYDRRGRINDTVWVGNGTYLDLAKDGKYGLVKTDGTVALDFQWDKVNLCELNENFLPVANEKKWGFVNVETGCVQVELIYDEVKFFKEGVAPVRVGDKWGMVDMNGNIIAQAKYLIDSHFVENFAIVFEGGSCKWGYNSRMISDSNCKIISKQGVELVTDCSWIDRTGKTDIFTLTTTKDCKKCKVVKQFLVFPEYIIIIEDGEYLKGYINDKGIYSVNDDYMADGDFSRTHYEHAKYSGDGNWTAIDLTGKEIQLDQSKIDEIKAELLKDV